MNGKGIFTSEQEKQLAQLLDDAVKLKGLAEIADGYIFRGIITFVDDSYADRLGTDIKDQLSKLATAVLEKDFKTAEIEATSLLNSLVDIPGLGEESEALLFKGAIELIVAAVQKWIERRGEKVE